MGKAEEVETLTIPVSDDLKSFIANRVSSGVYSDASHYIVSLVCADLLQHPSKKWTAQDLETLHNAIEKFVRPI